MSDKPIFTNRRQNDSRRKCKDPCNSMPMDLFHRKRRRNSERRAPKRSLYEDYFAYIGMRDSQSEKQH